MPPLAPRNLLVASIGNPLPAYANTLHSAGHTIVSQIQTILGLSPFVKDRSMGNGLVSQPQNMRFGFLGFKAPDSGEVFRNRGDWTLWQSTSLMNVSGPGLRQAWDRWSRRRKEETGMGKPVLVVVHDELERDLGKMRVVVGLKGSARGHNGLKSLQEQLPHSTPLVRIGVGIGRPRSRDPDEVSRYVLKKMSPQEYRAMEGAFPEIMNALRDIEEGKYV